MNEDLKEARRYHWQSQGLPGFFESPHTAIEGRNVGAIVNLADVRAERSRGAGLELVLDGPDRAISVLRRARDSKSVALSLFPEEVPALHLQMPHRHEVQRSDVMLKRLHGTLAAAAAADPKDYAELLLTPGVGARMVEALAFVAEVLHGAPARFKDPARFSLAHGGKDGHPFPVPIKVFDDTIRVLKLAVRAQSAQFGGLTVAGPVPTADRLSADAPRSSAPTHSSHYTTHHRRLPPAKSEEF